MSQNTPKIDFRYPRKEEAIRKANREKRTLSSILVELLNKWLK